MMSVSSALVSETSLPAQVDKTYFMREFSRTREVSGVSTGMTNFHREGAKGDLPVYA